MTEASLEFSEQAYFLRRGVVSPTPNTHDGGLPLVGWARLLNQYVRSCPLYQEAVSSTRNPRTRHAMVNSDMTGFIHNLTSAIWRGMENVKIFSIIMYRHIHDVG